MLLMERVRESARQLMRGRLEDALPHYRDLIERTALAYGLTPARLMRESGEEIMADITQAVRFRVEPRASQLLIEMSVRLDQRRRLAASARHLFLPAEVTWFELDHPEPSQRFGALARCEGGDLKMGKVTIWSPIKQGTDYETYRVPFDLRGRTPVWIPASDADLLSHIMSHNAGRPGEPVRLDATAVGSFLLAVLAFLCSPSAWVAREVAFDKLNTARARKGNWPLLAYHECKISVGGDPPTVSPASGKGPERALHFVRAHLRVRSTGRVEMVRPHWRGNSEFGIRRPAYAVTP